MARRPGQIARQIEDHAAIGPVDEVGRREDAEGGRRPVGEAVGRWIDVVDAVEERDLRIGVEPGQDRVVGSRQRGRVRAPASTVPWPACPPVPWPAAPPVPAGPPAPPVALPPEPHLRAGRAACASARSAARAGRAAFATGRASVPNGRRPSRSCRHAPPLAPPPEPPEPVAPPAPAVPPVGPSPPLPVELVPPEPLAPPVPGTDPPLEQPSAPAMTLNTRARALRRRAEEIRISLIRAERRDCGALYNGCDPRGCFFLDGHARQSPGRGAALGGAARRAAGVARGAGAGRALRSPRAPS